MLCEATQAKGRDAWKLKFSDVEADATTGRAHWQAYYRFSATGRPIRITWRKMHKPRRSP